MSDVNDAVRPHGENEAGDATPRPTRIISRSFVLAWLVNFAQYTSYYVLVTTLAVYAIMQFAASDAEGGLVSSAFIIGATLARPFAGPLVDAFGKRRMLLMVLVLGIAACALYLPADSLGLLIAVRVFHGATFAVVSTACMALAQSALPDERRAEGTGYLVLSATVATAIAPVLGIGLIGSFDYDALFWTALGLAVASLALGLLVRESRTGESRRFKISWRSLLTPAVLPIGAFMMLVGLAFAGIVTYLNGFGIERGLLAGAALFFPAYAVTMILGRLFMGRLQDRRGDGLVIAIGSVAMLAAPLVLAVADADWHLVTAGVLCGLGYGTLMPAAQTIAVRSVPPERVASGISTLFLFTDLGFGIGPFLLGFIVMWWGYGWLFLALGGVMLAAGVGYAAANWRRGSASRS